MTQLLLSRSDLRLSSKYLKILVGFDPVRMVVEVVKSWSEVPQS